MCTLFTELKQGFKYINTYASRHDAAALETAVESSLHKFLRHCRRRRANIIGTVKSFRLGAIHVPDKRKEYAFFSYN